MYKQVKDENDQLRDELEGLKKKLETKDVKSLATSWSEVGGEELLPSPPPEDTLGGSLRLTPGGSRVASGCPRDAQDAAWVFEHFKQYHTMTPYMDNLMEETLMLSWEPIVAEKHPSRKAVVVNPQTESLH